ncbi:MAG: hypothetical protein MJ214_02000 [Bacilli bacterium]|nr:hypothetical protein [Bacilli bacterium]
MRKTKFFYFISTALLAIPMTISCSKGDDFTILRNAYKNYLIETINTDSYTKNGPEALLNDLKTETIRGVQTYYFKDIDYNDDGHETPSSWKVAKHTSDMLAIAVAAAKTHDSRYQDIAVGLTYNWVFHDYKCVNWWFNDLGCGASLSSTALFVFDDLNEDGKTAVLSRVARQSFYYNESLLAQSGSNLFDYADCSLKSSIIHRNRVEMEFTIQRIEDEIVDTADEGFKKDGSFFQHGQLIQTMSNYGRSIIRLANILTLIDKTSRRFSTDKLQILTHFILRGISRGMFKGYSNYLEAGREYARDDESFKVDAYVGLEKYLELSNLPARHEFEEFIFKLKSRQPTFNGITYFEDSKFVTMNLDGLYMSFEGSDPNLINTETVNGENILGLNLSYGTNTCVMDKGNEYYRIAPVWDYNYMPGTTSYTVGSGETFESADAELKRIALDVYKDTVFGQKLPTGNDYVYSGSYDKDNNIAVLMQRSCHHKENNFTVTCIACEDGMFLMGADIHYDGGETSITNPDMHTTIEQCFYKGKGEDTFKVSEDGTELIHGNAYYKVYGINGTPPETITIRGLTPDGTDIDNEVTGNWTRNNGKKTGEDATGNILLAYIDHKDKGVTDNPASYAYSIQPKSYHSGEDIRDFKLINNFNNKKIQEVKLPSDDEGYYKAVVVAYEDVNTGYKTCTGEVIEKLEKGKFYIVEGQEPKPKGGII